MWSIGKWTKGANKFAELPPSYKISLNLKTCIIVIEKYCQKK